jgi:hypothetical protein
LLKCGLKQFIWLIVHEHGKNGLFGLFMEDLEFLGDSKKVLVL